MDFYATQPRAFRNSYYFFPQLGDGRKLPRLRCSCCDNKLVRSTSLKVLKGIKLNLIHLQRAIRGCVNARMVALSHVISVLFQYQSIAFSVCLRHISMRRRSLCKNLNPFTSNYAVISLPDFLRDEMRELN